MDTLRTAVLEATLPQVAQAMHHGKVSAGSLKNAGKYRHIARRFPGLSREVDVCLRRRGWQIAVEPLADESEIFEPDDIEQGKRTRSFCDDFPQFRQMGAGLVRQEHQAARPVRRHPSCSGVDPCPVAGVS